MLIITSIVTNLLKATSVSMMNISKVQAHKLPKAATSTLQLVWYVNCKLKQISASLTFPNFPDFSLTTLEFPDFSRFSR